MFTIGEFNGRERMTLGVDVVNRAGARILLATGTSKAEVVARWVREARRRGAAWIDETLPVAAIGLDHTVVYLDRAAAAGARPVGVHRGRCTWLPGRPGARRRGTARLATVP